MMYRHRETPRNMKSINTTAVAFSRTVLGTGQVEVEFPISIAVRGTGQIECPILRTVLGTGQIDYPLPNRS